MTRYISSGNLSFNDDCLEQFKRIQSRPLMELSDYVVDELPSELSELRKYRHSGNTKNFEESVEGKLSSLVERGIEDVLENLNEIDKGIAILDLRMLQSAVYNSGGNLSFLVKDFYKKLSDITDNPNILTYEDMVVNNPTKDIRTFTKGNMGYFEALFYIKTMQIEDYFAEAADFIFDAGFLLEDKVIIDTHSLLKRASKSIDKITEVMKQLKGMNPDYFLTFRDYWKATDPNLMGVSAYFSHGVKRTDLLFAGKKLGTGFFESLEKELSEGYYANQISLSEAIKSANDKISFIDLIEGQESINGDTKNLYKLTLEFAKSMQEFRKEHVKRVLEVNLTQGTAGKKSLNAFFESRMQPYKDIISSLQEKLE